MKARTFAQNLKVVTLTIKITNEPWNTGIQRLIHRTWYAAESGFCMHGVIYSNNGPFDMVVWYSKYPLESFANQGNNIKSQVIQHALSFFSIANGYYYRALFWGQSMALIWYYTWKITNREPETLPLSTSEISYKLSPAFFRIIKWYCERSGLQKILKIPYGWK